MSNSSDKDKADRGNDRPRTRPTRSATRSRRATQFKPGVSGNPKGRPKGSVNLRTRVQQGLRRTIVVNKNGRPTRMAVLDVISNRVLGHDDARDERRKGGAKQIGRPMHYYNSATIYPIKPGPVRLERASHANARGHPSRRRSPVTPLRGPYCAPDTPLMRCLPPTAGRVSDKPKIFIIPKDLALFEKFGLCHLRQFCGYFEASLRGRLALDRLTHCKDECLSVTKAPEPVCSPFAVLLQ